MTYKQRIRTLQSIMSQAEKLREEFAPTDPTARDDGGDEQMFYLLGGIYANAEDAKGALESEHAMAAFDAMIRGGIAFAR